MYLIGWAIAGALIGALVVGVTAGLSMRSPSRGVAFGFSILVPLAVLAIVETMVVLVTVPGSGFWHTAALTWPLVVGGVVYVGVLGHLMNLSEGDHGEAFGLCAALLLVVLGFGAVPAAAMAAAPVSNPALVVHNAEYLAAEANHLAGTRNPQEAPRLIRGLAAAGTTIPHTRSLTSTWIPTPRDSVVAFDVSVNGVSSVACLVFHRASASWTIAPHACAVAPLSSNSSNIHVVRSSRVG